MVYRREGFQGPVAEGDAEGAKGKENKKVEVNGVLSGVEGLTLGEKEMNGAVGSKKEEKDGEEQDHGATQGIWLARVRPEDCEGIIKYTALQGKVVKPQRQLRGGFDRGRGLVSW